MIRRFWERVNRRGPVPKHRPRLGRCWVWMGARSRGYGQVYDPTTRKMLQAHRVSWTLTRGPIPKGLLVLHACDGGSVGCVRPSHLFVGTQRDNMRDKIAKGRDTRGEAVITAKLTTAQIRDIRRHYRRGTTQTDLGRRYGVSQAHISRVVRGHSWNHVETT